jgi:endonuclease/exonuclease/phosphatase family metal-dependent hydrolase
MDGRVDPERIAREARGIADFDVLCLQEVAVNFSGLSGSQGEDQPKRLAAALSGYTPLFVAATDVPDGRGGRSQFGNMILSRLPVKQVFRHLLPWPSDPGRPSMQRALLEAVVAAPFGELRIMTTHLEYYSATMRMAQVQAVRQLHQEACALSRHPRPGGESGEPIFDYWPRPASAILTERHELQAGVEEYVVMTAAFGDGSPGFRDAWEVVHPDSRMRRQWTLPSRLGETAYCCDFVFVTGDIAPGCGRSPWMPARRLRSSADVAGAG